MYVCLSVCLSVCLYVCMYVCMYVYVCVRSHFGSSLHYSVGHLLRPCPPGLGGLERARAVLSKSGVASGAVFRAPLVQDSAPPWRRVLRVPSLRRALGVRLARLRGHKGAVPAPAVGRDGTGSSRPCCRNLRPTLRPTRSVRMRRWPGKRGSTAPARRGIAPLVAMWETHSATAGARGVVPNVRRVVPRPSPAAQPLHSAPALHRPLLQLLWRVAR